MKTSTVRELSLNRNEKFFNLSTKFITKLQKKKKSTTNNKTQRIKKNKTNNKFRQKKKKGPKRKGHPTEFPAPLSKPTTESSKFGPVSKLVFLLVPVLATVRRKIYPQFGRHLGNPFIIPQKINNSTHTTLHPNCSLPRIKEAVRAFLAFFFCTPSPILRVLACNCLFH